MEQREYESLLNDVESRLERLRALYEQWFQGFERLEPTVLRKEVDRRMYRLRRAQPHNTALRFRFNTLYQRYSTFQAYWSRVSRQIEEGTYRRDVMRARKRREDARHARHEQRRQRDRAPELDIDVDLDELDVDAEVESALAAADNGSAASDPGRSSNATADRAAKATFGKPRDPFAERPRGASEAKGSDDDDARLRRLYQQYIEARRRNNERTDNVKYEKLARSVRDMEAKQKQKHKGKKIDFQVVVRNGRVGLKPITGE